VKIEAEKERLQAQLKTETYEKNGALYWSVGCTWSPPEDRPVPMDVFRDAGVEPPAGQQAAVTAHTDANLAAYRKAMENHVPSAEEMFEMRAAFGPGATVVNVITGKETKL
jgi:hypothetical protein